jgi:hypothetical protein
MKLTTTTQVSVDGVMQGNGFRTGITLQVYRPIGAPPVRNRLNHVTKVTH